MSPVPLSGTSSPVSSTNISSQSTPATDNGAFPAVNQQYVMVTGGLGFIGSHTCLELLKAGYNVMIVDNLSNSFREVFTRILSVAHRHFERIGGRCPQAELHNVHYQDAPAMRTLLESRVCAAAPPPRGKRRSSLVGVVHFAAFKAVDESIRQPLKYYRNNVSGLIDFLALLDEYNVHTFIFSSSASVYGTLANRTQTLREEHCVHRQEAYQDSDGTTRYAEQGCTGITNPYGRTKFFGEAILADIAASDPSWTILGLRYFNPVGCDPSGMLGEDPKGIPSNLVPVVVKVMTGQTKELTVYGGDWNTADGTTVRDFIHVTDVARGHIAALSAAQSRRIQGGFRTFNLGTGSGHSVLEVVTTMESVIQRAIPRKTVERRPGDVELSVAVPDRAAAELGWKAEKSLKDACQDIWNYLKMSDS